MHDYLRAIGFDSQMKRRDREKIIDKIIECPDETLYFSKDEETALVQYNKDFGEAFGVSVVGEKEKDGHFTLEYVYPYTKSMNMFFHEKIQVEKNSYGNSFAGVCDNVNIGVPLIFYIHNFVHYMNMSQYKDMFPYVNNVMFSGLSLDGMVILNVQKNPLQIQNERRLRNDRRELLEAAKEGSLEAIEILTLDDMDTYNVVSNRARREDVFTIVDSYCIPYGVETDKYSILGTIHEVSEMKNTETGEEIYYLSVGCNDLEIDLCINKRDLLGEPAKGRRFKGTIWLQGVIDYI